MSRIICLNGPRNVGKSITRDCFIEWMPQTTQAISFKDKLHELTMALFNLDSNTYYSIYNNRALKEVPQECFRVTRKAYEDCVATSLFDDIEDDRKYRDKDDTLCFSIREGMIYVSENVYKPMLGSDIFGRIVAEKLVGLKTYVEDSTAFVDELHPVIQKLGQENILLIRIYGRGDFSGDSRSYIPDGVIDNTVDIWNTGTRQEFLQNIIPLMTRFSMGK